MNINWKVRFRNPVFWINIILAIVLPILAHLGMNWEEMTTWAKLGEVLMSAIQNPVIVVAVIWSVWNAVNDPTTEGLGDSKQALAYNIPKKKGE